MYTELDRFEEAFKTQTALLKELFSLMQDMDTTTRTKGRTAQNLVDEISECLGQILELLGCEKLAKVEGLTIGLGLTVRSIPRRVAAINGGIELPALKNICEKIQTALKNRDRLVE